MQGRRWREQRKNRRATEEGAKAIKDPEDTVKWGSVARIRGTEEIGREGRRVLYDFATWTYDGANGENRELGGGACPTSIHRTTPSSPYS